MKMRITAVVVIATLHLALSIVAYGKAEVIEPDETTLMWDKATKVIAFPILWLIRLEHHLHLPRIPGLDWFSILMVLNSLFWGAVIVGTFVWLRRRLSAPQAAA